MTTHFKTNHQLRIESFMKLAGQELPQSPVVPDIKIRQLRAALILEEAFETIDALGFKVNARPIENNEKSIVGLPKERKDSFKCKNCDNTLYCYHCEEPHGHVRPSPDSLAVVLPSNAGGPDYVPQPE